MSEGRNHPDAWPSGTKVSLRSGTVHGLVWTAVWGDPPSKHETFVLVIHDGVKGDGMSAGGEWCHFSEVTPTDRHTSNAVLVFAWKDAPQALRDLSTSGGDEDWVIVQRNIPEGTLPENIGWDYAGAKAADYIAGFGSRYDSEDPPVLVRWDGTLCAVWIFDH